MFKCETGQSDGHTQLASKPTVAGKGRSVDVLKLEKSPEFCIVRSFLQREVNGTRTRYDDIDNSVEQIYCRLM
jgi:hypothetical protein